MIAEAEAPWKAIAFTQRDLRDSKIPAEWLLPSLPDVSRRNVLRIPYECGIMTAKELEITEKDAVELLGLMAIGELTSYELTLAFCKRAAIAQQLLNCLTQIWFDEALERARELDTYYREHKTTVGPFHGLPVSTKNQFHIKGKDVYTGFAAWVGESAKEDSPNVKFLREAGAVFFCQTNAPQGLQSLETVNNVTGRTLNGFNRELSPGGSSGGEGALVSFYGSPLGLAADGGGSTRVPAAYTGLVGMKCTSNRIPASGSRAPMKGLDSTPYAFGPVCRSVRDSIYYFKTILQTQPWLREPYLVPLPWRDSAPKSPVTIGVFTDDGVVKPHPPVIDAIRKLSARLDALPDFSVVEWTPFEHGRGYETYRRLLYPDGGEENLATMADSGEPVLPLTEWIMKSDVVKRQSIEELWTLNSARDDYRQQYLDNWQNRPDPPDLLICPVAPWAAARHDTSKYWGYTAIYNLLDYPACALSTGIYVDPANRAHGVDTSYKPRDNEFDAYVSDLYRQHGPEGYAGAPIAIQLVGRKWDDELVMEVAHRIEAIVKQDRCGQRHELGYGSRQKTRRLTTIYSLHGGTLERVGGSTSSAF